MVHWAANKLRVSKRTLYNLLQKGVITEDELRQKVVPWMGKFMSVGELAEVCKRSERTVYRWLEDEKVLFVQFQFNGFMVFPECLVDQCIAYANGGGL